MTIKGLGSKLKAKKGVVAAVATAVVALGGVATSWIEARSADSKTEKRTQAMRAFLEQLTAGQDESQAEMDRLFSTMTSRFESQRSRVESLERRLERLESIVFVGPPAPVADPIGCRTDGDCGRGRWCVLHRCTAEDPGGVPDVASDAMSLPPPGRPPSPDSEDKPDMVSKPTGLGGGAGAAVKSRPKPKAMLEAIQKKRAERKAARDGALEQMKAVF